MHDDWYPGSLPQNVQLEPYAYPESAFSFAGFHSTEEDGFVMGFASGNYAFGSYQVGPHGKVQVGKYVILNATNLFCHQAISIGDHSMFGWGSVVTDAWITAATTAERKALLEKAAQTKTRHLEFGPFAKPVVIEANVWVGFEAVIMPGVRLGRGCIVGCKTVVEHDVPPYAVIAGNPAKIIKYLEPNDTAEACQLAIRHYTREAIYQQQNRPVVTSGQLHQQP